MGDTPINDGKLGLLSFSTWPTEVDGEDGKKRTYHSVRLERSYNVGKDGKDDWQKSKIDLPERDLGAAIALLQNAHQALIKKS